MSEHAESSPANGCTAISTTRTQRLSDTPEWSQLLDRMGVPEQSERETMSLALVDDVAFFEVINALSNLEYDFQDEPTFRKATLLRHHQIHPFLKEVPNGMSFTIKNISWRSHCSKEPGYEQHSSFDCLGLQFLVRDNDDKSLHIQMMVHCGGFDYQRFLGQGLEHIEPPQSLIAERRGLDALVQEVSTTMALLCRRFPTSSKPPCLANLKCLLFLQMICNFLAKETLHTDRNVTAEGRWARAAIGASTWDAVEPTTVPIQQGISESWEAGKLSSDCPACQNHHTWTGPISLINSRTWIKVAQPTNSEYAAVSYCWGSYESDEELKTAVQLVVKNTPIEYLWIDRFCLSSDGSLREKEIHCMSDIYAKARLVLILPGAVIKELDNLQYDANGTALRVNEQNRERIGEQWTRAPWRSRYWTYQEAFMARATAVLTGSAQRPVISGAALDALATCPDGNVRLTSWHPLDNTMLKEVSHSYCGMEDGAKHLFYRSHQVCAACGQSQSRVVHKQPLLTLMGLNWHRESTEELDTVYSLLAMASQGDSVPVKYDLTMKELYEFLIRKGILGAEILALGAGYVGPRTSWMPKRNHHSQHLVQISLITHICELGREEEAEAVVDDRGSLSAAVVPATISPSNEGLFLHLKGMGVGSPLKVNLEEDSLETGLEAHVLAPVRLYQPSRGISLVLILSKAVEPGSVRQVRRVQIVEVGMEESQPLRKRGMAYPGITTVKYEL